MLGSCPGAQYLYKQGAEYWFKKSWPQEKLLVSVLGFSPSSLPPQDGKKEWGGKGMKGVSGDPEFISGQKQNPEQKEITV